MDKISAFITALSGFAWPALILLAGFFFRKELQGFLTFAKQQLASGAALKWKDFEFKGLDLASFERRDGSGYKQVPADDTLFDRRHASYATNKSLFLVHRVRPTGLTHSITQLPTYDVSVYLISHKNFGHMNDVQHVEYYFGHHFGLHLGRRGTKYIVENGTDGFAVMVNAYGPMLCEARIVFNDGTETTVSRYLDFEGTSYRFASDTNAADAVKAGTTFGRSPVTAYNDRGKMRRYALALVVSLLASGVTAQQETKWTARAKLLRGDCGDRVVAEVVETAGTLNAQFNLGGKPTGEAKVILAADGSGQTQFKGAAGQVKLEVSPGRGKRPLKTSQIAGQCEWSWN